MKMIDLWPTTIAVYDIPLDLCLKIHDRHITSNSKDWEDVITSDEANKIFCEFSTYEICDGWIRTLTTESNNNFELHCDSHYGNQLVVVVQLFGEEEKGGELVLYDPSWKNPQWMSDTINVNSNKHEFAFKIGQVIIFPSNVWHEVKTYYGSMHRTTLNLMLRKKR
jgi:hypothetical protein